MRAGHSSLKASLNRFNFVSTAAMMDILPENSKKEYPKSVTLLLRLEEKRFVQGVCYFINKIPKFITKKIRKRSKCTKY
jgi:hypothetical protein